MRMRQQCVVNGALAALLCSIAVAQQGSSLDTLPVETIIQALQQAQAAAHPQVSYQIIREYRLFGAKDSKADSEVVAEVNFRPPSVHRYTIQRYSGSSRGPELVRRILDREVGANSKDNKASIAISSDNYLFAYKGEATLAGKTCYVLGLKPKRAENGLLAGQVWVDKHSFLIRQIQGDMEKTPSWWVKKIRIKLVFADREGVWMQTSMEAVADVRVVGSHTLTSRILDYRREAEVAASPLQASSNLRKR